MNLSWSTKIINESSTNSYFSNDLVEESIAKTLRPVMNKMKKLNIGLPYRDARLFFFNFLKEKHPNLIPAGYETRKPSAKDVNAIVGQIAIEQPDLLDKFGEEFDNYSKEQTSSGIDRVSEFLNVAATMRTGKGVRPSKAAADTQGYVKKDYSKLTAQEIANATTDAIKKKEAQFEAGDDVSDEKLLIKTVSSSVLTKLADEDVNKEALKNVADAMVKIETLPRFKQFLDYIEKMEEYSVIHQYLSDQLDVIETNLEDMKTEKEDAEMAAYEDEMHHSTGDEDAEIDAEKSDLDKDGKLSEYEKKRGQAIADAMEEEDDTPEEDDLTSAIGLGLAGGAASAVGKAAIDKVLSKDEDTGNDEEEDVEEDAERCPVTGKLRKSDEEKEEEEEIRLSPQALNRMLAQQYKVGLQHRYSQERLNREGY